MSYVGKYTSGSISPIGGMAAAIYSARYLMRNINYFNPDGIWVFCGPQGSGKTLSAVQCVQQIAHDYPAARIISNIDFTYDDGGGKVQPEVFESYDQLTEEDNGIYGLVFLLDEIHVLWNSLESKRIPITEMAALCQMRKSRRLIVGTSQVYGRIAKPIREQLKYVIECRNYFKVLQHNIVMDPTRSVERNGTIASEVLCERWWFHTPELYRSYETLDKVKRIDRTAKQLAEVYRG